MGSPAGPGVGGTSFALVASLWAGNGPAFSAEGVSPRIGALTQREKSPQGTHDPSPLRGQRQDH